MAPNDEQSIEEILKKLNLDNKAVRNNGGGYYNHRLFWNIMSPDGGGSPYGELAEAINNDFNSFDQFTDFANAAAKQFDLLHGFVFIKEVLEVCAATNQDNP